MMAAKARVYLEVGERSVFAVSLDWPGWCRRAKTSVDALEALDAYRERYARVVTVPFRVGPLEVVGTVSGTSTTDFGALDARGPWDDVALSRAELRRYLATLRDCWTYFDTVVDAAPAALRRGPRGGGRDRDAVAAHVRETERTYARRTGATVAPRTPWEEQREALIAALMVPPAAAAWRAAYSVRRCAWHVIDHAWEIEDKSLA